MWYSVQQNSFCNHFPCSGPWSRQRGGDLLRWSASRLGGALTNSQEHQQQHYQQASPSWWVQHPCAKDGSPLVRWDDDDGRCRTGFGHREESDLCQCVASRPYRGSSFLPRAEGLPLPCCWCVCACGWPHSVTMPAASCLLACAPSFSVAQGICMEHAVLLTTQIKSKLT